MGYPKGTTVVLWLAGLTLASCLTASAQTLVEPERLSAARDAFDSAAGAPALRCEFNAIRPELNFHLRFQTGYVVDIPFSQFRGSGHGLNILTRVTPEGRQPAYLTSAEMLPDVPTTKLAGEVVGTFIVGEGAYDVEALIKDDQHRVCRSKWRIQAKRSGSERDLTVVTKPAAVEEFSSSGGDSRESKSAPRIARLTLLVHAAPLSPGRSKLQDDDVATLVGSVSSLLEQLRAQSVRLILFNLDQRSMIFRQDDFGLKDLEKVTAALNQLQLAVVDYGTLQARRSPGEMLVDLLQTELKDANPSSAVILLGPRSLFQGDTLPETIDKFPPAQALFYLQFQHPPHFLSAEEPGRPRMNRGSRVTESVDASGRSYSEPLLGYPGVPDGIEKLLARLKGKTMMVRSPHDLADAIRRMDAAVPSSPLPPPAPLPDAAAQPGPSVVDEDPVEVLMRLRDQVLEHATRIPNYTCVETIQRDTYALATGPSAQSCDTLLARRKQVNNPLRLKLDTTDKLRLDVALATDREIYSWAGASKFEEEEIDELVPEGALGTGPFAASLLSVFQSRSPRFTYMGDTVLDGRSLLEFSFKVPQEQSRYKVKMRNKEWVITGYTGTLLVDPKTAELVRLSTRTDELLPATGSCEMDASLEYGLVQLGAGDFLLPKVAHQRFIGRDASEAENTVTFSACREYRAESSVAFGERLESGSGSRDGAPSTIWGPLPPGIPVTVELITPIQGDSAAAGDRIEGRLAKPIRDAQQKTLVPEGAITQGRLMRVETRHSSPEELTVVLRWESLEVNGVRMPLSLTPNRRAGDLERVSSSGLRRRAVEIELPLPSEGRYGVYHFPGGRVDRGFRTEWFTAKP